jgi:hypothetical protein
MIVVNVSKSKKKDLKIENNSGECIFCYLKKFYLSKTPNFLSNSERNWTIFIDDFHLINDSNTDNKCKNYKKHLFDPFKLQLP